MTGEVEPQGEWPESLPVQVSRQGDDLGVWLYRSRAYWAVPAWFISCAAPVAGWQLIGRAINWS